MATLTVTESRSLWVFGGTDQIDRIEFRTTSLGSPPLFARATFGSSLFGGNPIRNNVVIDGEVGSDGTLFSAITVLMDAPGAFSAAGWTFADGTQFANVELIGSTGADTITGTSFHDILIGGNLGDALNGGGGSDTASYSNAPGVDGVGVNVFMLNTGLNTGHAAGDSYTSIENLTGSQFNDTLSANNNANRIFGLNGIDTLLGLGGEDTLFGGNGDDVLFGGTENDTLEGEDDNDTLFGGLGGDRLRGGDGSDTAAYWFASADANGRGVTVALLNTGLNTGEADGDTYSSIENLWGSDFDDTLGGNNAENTINGGFGDDTLVGHAGNDILRGGNDIFPFGTSGNDILEGGVGADVLDGGDGANGGGSDTASYANAGEDRSGRGVTARLLDPSRNTGQAEGDTYFSIENLIGSNFDDILGGSAVRNTIFGDDGHDTLDGQGGADTLDGGTGNDVYVVDNTDDEVIETSGTDRVESTVTWSLTLDSPGVEDLTLLGSNNINGHGTSGANVIIGNSGINTLTGGFGEDTISGGGSGDIIDGGGDTDILRGESGADIFRIFFTTDHTATEQIDGGDNADEIRFISLSGTLVLSALTASVETVRVSDAAGAPLAGGADLNAAALTYGLTLIGDNGATTITGSAHVDNIFGLGGNDILDGGAGADVLTGGSEADRYVFNSSTLADGQAGRFDRVVDFNQGTSGFYNFAEGDILDVSALLVSARANSQAASSLVRLLGSTNVNPALLQVDIDGLANGGNWVTLATLDGVGAGERVNVRLGGNATFALAVTNPIVPDIGLPPTNDFNADRSSDLLLRNRNTGEVAVVIIEAARPDVSITVGQLGLEWQVKGTGDFDRDGDDDILWRNSNTGDLRADLIQHGHYQSTAIVGQLGLEWQVQGTGDFDRDGDADILWRDVNTGQVRVDLIQNGQYQSTAITGQLGLEWRVEGTGDFDRDRDADILWRNMNSGDVRVDLIQNGQYQSTAITGQLGLEWQVQGTGDFDKDRDADILWRNTNTGDVRADLIQNGQYQSTAIVGQLGLEWQVSNTGDYDRDGDADILWQNLTTRELRIDLIENGQYQSTSNIGQLSAGFDLV